MLIPNEPMAAAAPKPKPVEDDLYDLAPADEPVTKKPLAATAVPSTGSTVGDRSVPAPIRAAGGVATVKKAPMPAALGYVPKPVHRELNKDDEVKESNFRELILPIGLILLGTILQYASLMKFTPYPITSLAEASIRVSVYLAI